MELSKLKDLNWVTKFKDESGVFKLQGWQWGHQNLRLKIGSSKIKVESGMMKFKLKMSNQNSRM